MRAPFFILFVLFPIVIISQSKIIAHRGASSIAPENTISAFSKAVELGCDYIEIDIRMSKDDSIMVIHDETIDRTTNGIGRVGQFTYQELKEFSSGYPDKFDLDFEDEKIPTLFEVLEFAKGKVGICIDTKNTSEAAVIDLIVSMEMEREVFLMSYNVEKLKNLKTINQQLQTILIKNTLTNIDLKVAQDARCAGVSTSYISSEFLAGKAHEKGLLYWAGIVNDPSKAESLFKNKVDAIITDYPQLMTMNNDDVISVSPNPFRKSVNIYLTSTEEIHCLYIIAANGSIIHEFLAPYPNPLVWKPLNNLIKGLYLIYMIKNETIIFEKILFID